MGRPVLMLSAVLIAVWVQLTRSSRVPLWDSFWAEDGRFFYGDAKERGFTRTIFEPLGGYLQVVPRALSSITAAVPVADAALTNALLASITVALLGLYVFVATEGVLRHVWQRVAAGAVLVAHPAAAFEVNAALNNVHWFLMVAAFWACCSHGTSRSRIVLDTAVVTLAALSDPLTGLLLPLVAWRAWRGHRTARWMTASLLIALAMQYWLGLAGQAPDRHGAVDLEALPGVYGLRVAASFLLGDRGVADWWPAHGSGWYVPLIALVGVGVGFGLAITFAKHHDRRLLATLLCYSVLFFVAPAITRGGWHYFLQHPFTQHSSRYMIVPLAFLYEALIVAVGLPWPLPAPLRKTLLPALAIAMLVVQLTANYTTLGPRQSGASWRQAVATARAGCRAHRTGVLPGPGPASARPRISGPIVLIPEPPWTSTWSVPLRCDQLD